MPQPRRGMRNGSIMRTHASTPQRGTAWYGIRMVRDLKPRYLSRAPQPSPRAGAGPPATWPGSTAPPATRAGAFQPLCGASMAKDYPELLKVTGHAVAAPPSAPPADGGAGK